jgi:hypothetical protein
MTLRASTLRGSSKMPAHLVFAALPLTPLGPPSFHSRVVSHLCARLEQGFSSDLRVHHTKNPQPGSVGFVVLWREVQPWSGLIINALR